MVRKMQRRGLDAVALSGAGLPSVDKSVNCLNVPLLFESYEELDYVRDRVAPELERRMEQSGFKVLNWSDAGWVYFFSRRPARTPDDLRKMKIWTSSGDPETEKLFKDLGFQVVPLPATDMLTSLQTGLIEVIDVPPLYAMLDRTYQVASYMIDLRWAPLMAATVISKSSWERIPEGYRQRLLDASRRAGAELRDEIRKAGEDAVEEMRKRGLTVIELDEAARLRWKAEAESVYPRIRGTLAPADLFDEVMRLSREFRERRSGAWKAEPAATSGPPASSYAR
jgi:TRAP-type C4-dicarboxylate transport system substrate-binding protein